MISRFDSSKFNSIQWLVRAAEEGEDDHQTTTDGFVRIDAMCKTVVRFGCCCRTKPRNSSICHWSIAGSHSCNWCCTHSVSIHMVVTLTNMRILLKLYFNRTEVKLSPGKGKQEEGQKQEEKSRCFKFKTRTHSLLAGCLLGKEEESHIPRWIHLMKSRQKLNKININASFPFSIVPLDTFLGEITLSG